MAKMIGLDLGASQWRVGYTGNSDEHRTVAHRFSSVRFPPFLQKEFISIPGPDKSDTLLGCNNVKRFLGKDGVRAVIGETTTGQWLARRLAGVLDDVAEELDTKCLGVVIPLPSCFRDRERAEVLEAASSAGFQFVHTPEESTLSLNGFLGDHPEDGPVLYFHLGAGTLNLSVFARESPGGQYLEIGYEGTAFLGGDDFDIYLMHLVLSNAQHKMGLRSMWDLRQYVDEELRRECERMRHDVCSGKTPVSSVDVGHMETPQGSMPAGFQLQINEDSFRTTVSPLVRSISEHLERLLAKVAQKGITRDQITRAVIAGGAASNMPYIWQSLFHEQGLTPEVHTMDGDHVVRAASRYAATFLAELAEKEMDLQGQDITQRTVAPYDLSEDTPKEERTPAADPDVSPERASISGPATQSRREHRWLRDFGPAINQAEELLKTDPIGATQRLQATALDLLELAQEIARREPDGIESVFRIQLLRSAASDAVTLDPLIGVLVALADAASTVHAYDTAHEALAYAKNRVKKLGRKESPQKGNQEECRRIVHLMDSEALYREAIQRMGKFDEYCRLARETGEAKRYCLAAAKELQHSEELLIRCFEILKSVGPLGSESKYEKLMHQVREKKDHCGKELGFSGAGRGVGS